MKILHCVESYFPSKGGMQEVVKQLSERLVALGHEVTVATGKMAERDFKQMNGVHIVDFEISGNFAGGMSGQTEAYRQFLLNSEFDIVAFFAAQQWATDLALDILPQIKGKKVSVPTGYSGFNWPAYKDYFEKMRTWIHGYDMNVYLSHDYRDINFAKENKVTKTIVIPNGASANEFIPEPETDVREALKIPADQKIILHVGSYTGRKGHKEAVEIFLRSSIKNATLLMIGNGHEFFYRQYIKQPGLFWLFLKNKLFGSKKIIFNTFSREFTVAAYKQSDIFLFPSNIECSPIVLFECAAAKLPFIATDVGNTPEIADWTKGGIIARTSRDEKGFGNIDIADGIRLLEILYADENKRHALAEAAYQNWEEKFSWEKIAGQYEQMYLNLLK